MSVQTLTIYGEEVKATTDNLCIDGGLVRLHTYDVPGFEGKIKAMRASIVDGHATPHMPRVAILHDIGSRWCVDTDHNTPDGVVFVDTLTEAKQHAARATCEHLTAGGAL